MNLKPRVSHTGRVIETGGGWQLAIPAGGARQYRLAQLDDHSGLARGNYPCRPPMEFSLQARVSAATLPGTWGFGLWNDPYGFSFGPGSGLLRLPALPNSAWFFYSSPISYLSFRDNLPANGFLAQAFASPGFDPLLIRAALTLPFSRKRGRRLLGRIIHETAAALDGPVRPPGGTSAVPDTTQWHRYSLEWRADGTRFTVDGTCILDTPVSPGAPLGLVIWLDNQHAGFDPNGRLSFGLEANPLPAWLEIRGVSIR